MPTRGGRLGLTSAILLLDLLYLLAAPLLCLALLVASRALTRPKLRRGLLAKLGFGLKARRSSRPLFWVHAVSVGEVLTAEPLIHAIRRRFPDWDVQVSVSTFTGYETARKKLGEGSVIYSPLDFSFVLGRFFRRLKPGAVILIELELWPNLLLCARKRGLPVFVANGRLSDRSARRYRWGRGLTRKLFNLPTAIGAQNDTYRDRFLGVGVEPSRLSVLGNLKHDREPSLSTARAPELRARLGWKPGETLVLTAGSTHPGEEIALCAACARLKPEHPGLRLVLAPRHVERLGADELSRWGATEPLVRWSSIREAATGPPLTGILVVDTVGELEIFYAMADIVFVGGSMIPHGGQNLLEPARLSKPIIFGPYYHNFQEEGDLLRSEGAALQVRDATELTDRVAALLVESGERDRLSRKALEVTRRLGGAVGRHIDWLQGLLRLYLPHSS